jgi:hypothetical protein
LTIVAWIPQRNSEVYDMDLPWRVPGPISQVAKNNGVDLQINLEVYRPVVDSEAEDDHDLPDAMDFD